MDNNFLDSLSSQKSSIKLSRSNTFTQLETDTILKALQDELELSSTDEAKTVIAMLFQQGGTARSCDGNMTITIFGQDIKLAVLRKVMKQTKYARGERKLARTLADDIYKICERLEIPGNLYLKIKRSDKDISNLTFADQVWLSDFQNLNPNIPEKLRMLIEDSFKAKQPKQQKTSKKK